MQYIDKFLFFKVIFSKKEIIIKVKELLGHSDVKTTMRYSHLGPLATVDAIRSLSEQKYNIGHNMATICLP